MNLSQLYYFQHLAEVQHYTRAAEDLYITQPALSHAIASLEDELGCSLFQKDGRNMRLTDDGKLFKRYVDEGLNAIDNGISELKSRHGMLSGSIDIGAIATVRAGYLPAAMKAYRDEHGPLVEFHVYQGITSLLNQYLEQGVYDLVIGGPYYKSSLTTKVLMYQELAVVVPKTHPLANHESLTFNDLVGYDVITYRKTSIVGELLTKLLEDCQAPEDKLNLIRNYDDEVILGAIAQYEGVVALSLVTPSLKIDPSMAIIPLEEEGTKEFYPICMTYRSKAFRSVAAQRFIEFIETFEPPKFIHPLLQSEE
ncbi:MAG: LysR family transcriptional regulator [Eggerthellales bacterium]|nr:LysR family transcriptional regulator [Eggerthellales bacterium]